MTAAVGRHEADGIAQGLVGEMERIVAIELRTELLELLQDVERSVVARLRICRECGALFIAKKSGHRAKRCPACRS